MKSTTDYIVGNTAIQIVNKGKRIKVIDVEKEKRKKKIGRRAVVFSLLSVLLFGSCAGVVHENNRKAFLDRQVYILQGEIDELERNMPAGTGESAEAVDYRSLYKRAKELGMDFPKEEQVCRYTVEKSTAVRVYDGK